MTDEPRGLSLDELRARMAAAGITIPEHRLAMVRKLLSDALAPLRAVDARALRAAEPAVRFTPDAAAGGAS